jgi:hypothetical protein
MHEISQVQKKSNMVPSWRMIFRSTCGIQVVMLLAWLAHFLEALYILQKCMRDRVSTDETWLVSLGLMMKLLNFRKFTQEPAFILISALFA